MPSYTSPSLIRLDATVRHLKSELRIERGRTTNARKSRDTARAQRDAMEIELKVERRKSRELEKELRAKERRIESLLRAGGR